MSEGRTSEVPGYDYGAPGTAHAPLGMEELDLLKQTVLFTGEDERYLRMAGEVLEDQVEDVLDVWYGFVADDPHLITCRRSYDQEWLDYQQEIGPRHTHEKNETDGARGTPNHINMRYIVGFIYPITATMKPFLVDKGHSAEDVDKMHQAWFKSVVIQVALWCLPYTREGRF